MIKILVAGYSGSMGQQVLKLIDETPDFELVAVFALGATEVIVNALVLVSRSRSTMSCRRSNMELMFGSTLPLRVLCLKMSNLL